MTSILVVAKAPVPGLAKTRLARHLGDDVAADIAAAALLDTLDAVAAAAASVRVVAMTGDLGAAQRSAEIRSRLADFTVIEQRGDGFADRLANAHHDTFAATGGLPIVQIGMDTPQVTAALLHGCTAALAEADAVLGMARDGGWWALGLRDGDAAECLRDVPMSADDTGARTAEALRNIGVRLMFTEELGDVDTIDDIDAVRRVCLPDSRFSRVTATVEV